MKFVAPAVTVAALLFAEPVFAATLDGNAMSWPWAIPFAGFLLTIATGPLLFPKIWHHHYGKLALMWAVFTVVPIALAQGLLVSLDALIHAMLAEYMSFIILLFALYTVAGGILITGNPRGTPVANTAILGFGTVIASFVGTTGASMILIRPLLRANEGRKYNVHVFIFFIFLVSNIGGSLTPLGDPPLFVGFLRGVDFFWTYNRIMPETAFVAGIVLIVFFLLDYYFDWLDGPPKGGPGSRARDMRVRGAINLVLIGGIIAAILMSALWKPGISIDIRGTRLEAQNLLRDALLLLIAFLSVKLTPAEHRESNGFSWDPIIEVAKIFAAIFVTIIPVLAMLQAGRGGPLGGLLNAVTLPDGSPNNMAYFWITGALSSFLDNAPTYLVFFEAAGGNAQQLMGPLGTTLAAISMGAVYMGAMSYIGNAPNFMVYAIAVERGIKMPSFFGYMVWSCVVLLPVLALMTLIWLR